MSEGISAHRAKGMIPVGQSDHGNPCRVFCRQTSPVHHCCDTTVPSSISTSLRPQPRFGIGRSLVTSAEEGPAPYCPLESSFASRVRPLAWLSAYPCASCPSVHGIRMLSKGRSCALMCCQAAGRGRVAELLPSG